MSGWLSYRELLFLWHLILFHVIHFPHYFTWLFYLHTEQHLWNHIPVAKMAKWEWLYMTVLMQCLVSANCVFPRPRKHILRTAKYVISYRRWHFLKGGRSQRSIYQEDFKVFHLTQQGKPPQRCFSLVCISFFRNTACYIPCSNKYWSCDSSDTGLLYFWEVLISV